MGIMEQVAEMRAKEAREEGKLEGKLEGKVEGMLEGGIESSRRVAQSLVADGKYSAEEIAEMTELPIAFVRKLNSVVKG